MLALRSLEFLKARGVACTEGAFGDGGRVTWPASELHVDTDLLVSAERDERDLTRVGQVEVQVGCAPS